MQNSECGGRHVERYWRCMVICRPFVCRCPRCCRAPRRRRAMRVAAAIVEQAPPCRLSALRQAAPPTVRVLRPYSSALRLPGYGGCRMPRACVCVRAAARVYAGACACARTWRACACACVSGVCVCVRCAVCVRREFEIDSALFHSAAVVLFAPADGCLHAVLCAIASPSFRHSPS